MGLNIGLYLRRSEGPIRKSEVLVRKSDVLVRTSDQDGTKVEDSPIALVTERRAEPLYIEPPYAESSYTEPPYAEPPYAESSMQSL